VKVALAWGLALPVLLACGGAGTSAVSGTDADAIRTSAAGIASLAFLDLERLGPDQLETTAVLSGCIGAAPSAGAVTYAFHCPAAGSGTLTGTVTAQPNPKVPGGYTLAYDLTVTAPGNLPGTATPAWTWTYQGDAAVQVLGATATVTVAGPTQAGATGLKLVYTDNLNQANGKSFDFSASLATSWTESPRRLTIQGSFALDREGALVIAGSIAGGSPLVWTSCDFPMAGVVDLDLLPAAGAPEQAATVITGCGSMTVMGAPFHLGD
jgi:hypothetical protein